jgi:dTDP-4-amino-4,6-dideoxygalactose transaminase
MTSFQRADFLPFSRPCLGEEEIAQAVETLRSGWLSTGAKTTAFEKAFGAYVGASNTVAVNSCTAGLHLALLALGVMPGDEVIVPTMTFCASANVVVHAGARPVLVDVGEDLNVDVEAIAAAITPRTKALMPVHYGGQPCDLDAIYELADRHSLAVVEDAAHAVGAAYRGSRIGSDHLSREYPNVRRATAFSFYATKNMTTGEGGMVTLEDDELAERIRRLSLHGMSHGAWDRYTASGSWAYDVEEAGYKYNLSDIQSAIGLSQLEKLPSLQQHRLKHVQTYDRGFEDLTLVSTLPRHAGRTHAHHLYPIRLKLQELSIDRQQFILSLNKLNIGTSVHFIPLHLHSFYQEQFAYREGAFPVAERIYHELVSLPLFACMNSSDVEDVVAATSLVLERASRHPTTRQEAAQAGRL